MTVVYSCDTSVFIQAWVKDYRPKTFPGVWKRLEQLIVNETLIAPEDVLKELARKEDGLHGWAKGQRTMFVPMDEPTQVELSAILRDHCRLVEHRPGRSGTDPIVIALAKIRNAAVLTDENRSGSLRKPRIPDVCLALGIDCCNLADLFDRNGFVFS